MASEAINDYSHKVNVSWYVTPKIRVILLVNTLYIILFAVGVQECLAKLS